MKKKKLLINIIKMIVSYLTFRLSNLFVLLPVKIFNINLKTASTPLKYTLNIYQYLCIIIILYLMYRKELKEEFKRFKSNLGKNMDTALKYYFIGLFIMMASNIVLNFILKLGNSQNENAVQNMIKAAPILMIITAGVLAPIVEELIFRKSFKNVFTKKWVFAIVSGLVFGSMHIIGYKLKTPLELLYVIPYGALGSAFACMDYDADSTFPSIVMHMIHNTLLSILSIMVK